MINLRISQLTSGLKTFSFKQVKEKKVADVQLSCIKVGSGGEADGGMRLPAVG